MIYRIEDNRFAKERTKRRKDRWKMGEKNNLIREGEKNLQFGTGSLKRKCTKYKIRVKILELCLNFVSTEFLFYL